MAGIEDHHGGTNRAEEFLQIFKKGAEFTQDLLKENERLRFQILKLEEKERQEPGAPSDDATVRKLQEKIAALEEEKAQILDRIREVEEENLDFANRYVDIENENNMLANLYIASYQLHSTLDFNEVLQIILEIVINLIGAEQFGVMLLDEKTNSLRAVGSEGIERDELPVIELGEGVIGQMAKTGENYFVDDLEHYQKDLTNPMVCIPLKIKEHVIGVIVIYSLLEQKSRFAEVDYELFTLLAGHAATAIFSSKLYSESERKLTTIQGFIDLMTK
ncbi:GAF domain-containing protein [Geothermobacter hydrogeniphilus]|uniref:Diguanylate phosphodiesterase n=1 Tax=Geothermobacter hydrogeniphilus TaxID=1969733 RepID=A0A1X0YDX6_9BACT|nr:GAF domain-containing protein [Geothermobacter hydrogeniphilus]ORJ63346.1 diguanylate phosphodiesterase [Geothermobacter hydrogeniphilus]